MSRFLRAFFYRYGLRIAAPFIAGFEGGQSADGLFRPYQDVVGVWTIGYGHTQGVGPRSKALTKKQAINLLREDLARSYGPAIKNLKLPLYPHEVAALVSFVYNLGPGAIASNTGIGDALRKHRWKLIADEMLKWDKAGSPPRRLEGLTRRRQAERKLFLKDRKH